MEINSQERILNLLEEMPKKGLKSVKELFWNELNYPRANEELPIADWPEGAKEVISNEEPPILLAQYENTGQSFDVIYTKLAEGQIGRGFPLSITAERSVITQLSKHHPFVLYIFSNKDETHWHFVNMKYERAKTKDGDVASQVVRRISIGPKERLRTAAERISLLNLARGQATLFKIPPLDIQMMHDEAFDVQKVTEDFFQDYKKVFNNFQDDLYAQSDDKKWAHDYALQFLNRVMFIHYVQRKRWLDNDVEFLANFWKLYKNSQRPKDSFVIEWLSVLFFEAFNNKFTKEQTDHHYLPEKIREALEKAPFLNGGLFKRNELDNKYSSVIISDDRIENIFNFYENYNFTISEDTPLDQEVAVDPEMIGKVYESLVNVSEQTDERGDAGIFYTPRVEIDLMSRLSIVDWLTNHLGDEYKSNLYEVVLAFNPEDKTKADNAFAELDLWVKMHALLRKIKAVDPACGSGSFLIGMLYVIDDLIKRAATQLGQEEKPYDRKKRIIGDSLYGVDVMEWAVHVAELRLWLQLIIETDLDPDNLQGEPLLPNLSFNIRPGDSLIQEAGGIDFALARKKSGLMTAQKNKIEQLISDKKKFYNNDPTARHKSKKSLQEEELNIFREILDSKFTKLDKQRKEKEMALRPQSDLFGERQTGQKIKDKVNLEKDLDEILNNLAQLKKARQALKDIEDIPFVWDIAFVEVFEGSRKGFDIVIGNPPYVRQEDIRDPKQSPDMASTESKRAYKNKLRRSAYTVWPKSFGYDWSNDTNSKNTIGLRSDLYLYFYLHGLSLLNEKGSFCFITSNSWLDVKYGKSLQKFLLTRGKVKLIIDNEMRRTFKGADVNTVIALLSKPKDNAVNVPECLGNTARFVMLKTPFEQALSPVFWEEIEDAEDRQSMPEYRVFPLDQNDLLENGIDHESKKYAGDKWGGKYLRAPEIYWTIMEKANDKFVRLGDIADVRFGIKTGANAFFYLDDEKINKWGIEEELIKPVIKSPRECKTILINSDTLQYKLFLCNKTREELRGTGALRYIEWGETQNYHNRPTTSSRTRWWDLGTRSAPHIIIPASYNDLYRVFLNTEKVFVDKRLYEVRINQDYINSVYGSLNSTLTTFFLEIISRTGLGEGLIDLTVYETELINILHPRYMPEIKQIENREILPIERELISKERRNLDNLIFDVINLTKGEREAVYKAVANLVNTRLQKADSV